MERYKKVRKTESTNGCSGCIGDEDVLICFRLPNCIEVKDGERISYVFKSIKNDKLKKDGE